MTKDGVNPHITQHSDSYSAILSAQQKLLRR
jgi:hypothetical protein